MLVKTGEQQMKISAIRKGGFRMKFTHCEKKGLAGMVHYEEIRIYN